MKTILKRKGGGWQVFFSLFTVTIEHQIKQINTNKQPNQMNNNKRIHKQTNEGYSSKLSFFVSFFYNIVNKPTDKLKKNFTQSNKLTNEKIK